MSRMSELAAALDDLTEIGRQLTETGNSLIRAAARVKDCFSGEEVPEPVKQPEKTQETAPETEPTPKTYSKEEVRVLLADMSQAGLRAEAKALVKKYSGGGSLTDIDPARYPELVEEAKSCNA